MDLSEYVFELLRADEELALHRGRPGTPTTSGCRSILLLGAVCEHPAPATLKRLEHEYALERELRSAWAAQPIALTEHQGRTTLVLEDPGGEPLDGLLRAPMEVGLFLRVAVGLVVALRQLHAQGIIHKDVKPANLLVDTATGGVWLMGFGIASTLRPERQAPEPPDIIAGSLPYMAPEQTGRMNRSIDSRADLYAAGVTLYEMLTGSLPFNASDPMEWVHSHIARRPAPRSRETLRSVARGRHPARRLRPDGDEREAGAGAGFRVLGHRQVVGGQRGAQGARAPARPLRFREVRSVQARHPLRHARPGLSGVDPIASGQERGGAGPLARGAPPGARFQWTTDGGPGPKARAHHRRAAAPARALAVGRAAALPIRVPPAPRRLRAPGAPA